MLSKIIVIAALLAVTSAASIKSLSNPYQLSSAPGTFLQGWAYCKNAGLKFAALTTAERNEALSSVLYNMGASTGTFWVGGYYLQLGFLSKWYWVEAQENVIYTNWRTSTVSTTSNSCIAFSYSATTKSGTWVSETCNASKYFVCSS